MHSVSLAMHESTRLQEKVEDQVALACYTAQLSCIPVHAGTSLLSSRIMHNVYCTPCTAQLSCIRVHAATIALCTVHAATIVLP